MEHTLPLEGTPGIRMRLETQLARVVALLEDEIDAGAMDRGELAELAAAVADLATAYAALGGATGPGTARVPVTQLNVWAQEIDRVWTIVSDAVPVADDLAAARVILRRVADQARLIGAQAA